MQVLDDVTWLAGPLVSDRRIPLPDAKWRPATPAELAVVGLSAVVVDETGCRPFAPDASGRRWLLDGSGDVA